MQTVGYQTIRRDGTVFGPGLIFAKPLEGVSMDLQAPVVRRDEAEKIIDRLQSELAGALAQLDTAANNMNFVTRQVKAWEDTAAHFHRGMDFYRGIVRQVGQKLGREAYVSDDGSVQDEVLALKVPEIVEDLVRPGNRLLRSVRILLTGKY